MIRRMIAASISVVVLSIGAAAVASPAGANTFQAGGYPATVTGKATSELKVGNGTKTIICSNVGLSGKLAAASEELQLTPSFPKCTTSEGLHVTVTTDELKFDVHWLGWTWIFPDWYIKVTGKWTIHVWTTSKAAEEEKPPLCTFVVAEAGNAAVQTINGTNEGAGTARHLVAEFNLTNLLILRTAGTEANCGKEKQSSGTATGKFNLTATTEGKESGLWFQE